MTGVLPRFSLVRRGAAYSCAEAFVVADDVGKDAAADDPLVLAGQAPQPVCGRGWQVGCADLAESSERSVLGAAVGCHGGDEPVGEHRSLDAAVGFGSMCSSACTAAQWDSFFQHLSKAWLLSSVLSTAAEDGRR